MTVVGDGIYFKKNAYPKLAKDAIGLIIRYSNQCIKKGNNERTFLVNKSDEIVIIDILL